MDDTARHEPPVAGRPTVTTTEGVWMQSATRWVPTLVWMGVIFAGSSQPGTSIPGGWSVEGHLVEYAVLAALVAWRLRGQGTLARAFAVAVLVASLYGVTDEVHQAFTPGRVPDPLDWATDTIGALAGALTVVGAVALAASRRQTRQ